MEIAYDIYNYLITTFGAWGCGLILVGLILFAVQLCYWLGPYYRIPKYSISKHRHKTGEAGGISVVVILREDRWYLDTILPRLLEQDYPEFEVMIVAVDSDEDFENDLDILKARHPNLSTTSIAQDPRFPISNKMAYNVGIKGSRYENIVLTTSEAVPVSHKWLSMMAKGFEAGDVVLGYCGMERKHGLVGNMTACDRMMTSVRYLAAAVKGKPYRGIVHNLGFTRKTYFDHKGFNHLNMNIGEDDLFVQSIADGTNTVLVMNPHATLRQMQWGGASWWWGLRRFYTTAYRYYPSAVRSSTEWELGSRLLFYVVVAILAAIMPWQVAAAAGALWLTRLFIVRYQLWRIRKRLGEKGLGASLMLHDLISPVIEIILSISRRIRPVSGVWR